MNTQRCAVAVLAAIGCGGASVEEVSGHLSVKGAPYALVGAASDPATAGKVHTRAGGVTRIYPDGTVWESAAAILPTLAADIIPNARIHCNPPLPPGDDVGVIGNDERVATPDSAVYNMPATPNAVVGLHVPNDPNNSVICSSTFIGLHTAVLAAHCIFDPRTSEFRMFDFAAEGSRTAEHFVGSCASSMAVPSAYINNHNVGDFQDDYAVIDFTGCSDNLGAHIGSIIPLANVTEAGVGNAVLWAFGYSFDCGCSESPEITAMCTTASTQAPGTPAAYRTGLFHNGPLWGTQNLDLTDGGSGEGLLWPSAIGWRLIGTAVGSTLNSSGQAVANYWRVYDSTYQTFVANNTGDF